MNAISLNSTIFNVAKIVGPAISGIVMVKFGPVYCFFLNGLSYLAVLWGLLLIKTPDLVVPYKRRNILQEIKAGLKYIKNSEILTYNVIVLAVVCTFAMNTDVLVPVFAKTVLGKGATAYTALMSAMGVGSLCGALFMANVSKDGS